MIWQYVLLFMLHVQPPRPTSVPQLAAYSRIAAAIAGATDDPDEAILLASIGHMESGYHERAVGKLGELGVWQLMAPAPKELAAQAKEALRRIRVQGMCGFTGEAANPQSKCPLARHREALATAWRSEHPY